MERLYGTSRLAGMMAEIDVRKFKDVDLKGGTVFAALPSVGLVSTIAATYMISALKMDQIMALDADDFPPLSMVYGHKPKFPVRVYAAAKEKVACFISEVPLPPKVHRPLARQLLEWARAQGARWIICLEGLPMSQEPGQKQEQGEVWSVWGVGSTEEANAALENAGVEFLETGIVTGVAGVLLNEGRWAKYDVVALLAEARAYLPDANAAAKLVQTADQLLPEIKIDLAPLIDEAKALEQHLQTLKEQAMPVTTDAPASIYR